MADSALFKCPVCEDALALHGKSYACANSHSYDISREGYVNLLLAQHKRSRNPGDSAEMIRSRQRFLNKGYYQCLSEAIVRVVGDSSQGFEQRLLDIGCGEGYYLHQLREAASAGSKNLQLLGIDISKPAVRLAAKRKMDAQLAVNSAYTLPLFDETVDTALSVFSPVSAAETARVLTSNGRLIMVGPGGQHLSGLTAHIYEQSVPHEGNYQVLDSAVEFTLQHQLEVKQSIRVLGEDILDLLTMTPYYWHCQPEQQEMLANLPQLDTPVHFYINIYQKNPPL